MAYVSTDLGQIAVAASSDDLVQIFVYKSDADDYPAIAAADYFGDVDNPNVRLKDGDLVYVQGTGGASPNRIGRYDAASRSLSLALTFA